MELQHQYSYRCSSCQDPYACYVVEQVLQDILMEEVYITESCIAVVCAERCPYSNFIVNIEEDKQFRDLPGSVSAASLPI